MANIHPINYEENMKSLNNSKPLAMYVDDDPSMLDIFGDFIESCGLDLVKFLNPKDALEEIKNNPTKYQVLITDFNMPEMNGLELLEKLKAESFYGINYFAVFSSMVNTDSFLDKFEEEFSESVKPIVLIEKNNFLGKEALRKFIANVIKTSNSSD